MNRFNFGNQITNGAQILSVAGTTGAGFEQQSRRAKLADASSGLNNLSEEELRQIGQMHSDKLMDDVKRYNAGGQSPYQHLSPEEAGEYQSKVADDMRKKINKSDDVDVDDVMSDIDTGFEIDTPQMPYIKMKQKKDLQHFNFWKQLNEETKENSINFKVGGKTDADV